jgi:signal transduction histidine kinase
MSRQPFLSFGTTLGILLVAAMLGFSTVGLWLHRQVQRSLERETRARLESETLLLANRVQSLKLLNPEMFPLSRGTFRPGLRSGVAFYDTGGRRLAVFLSDDSGRLKNYLPAQIPGGGIPYSRLSGDEIHGESDFPIGGEDGGLRWIARVVVFDEKTRLSSSVARIVYEIPVWIVGVFALGWVIRMAVAAWPSRAPVTPGNPDPNELQFVMESYQQVIDRLQSTGRELARQRNVERLRAESSERFSDRLVAGLPDALIVVSVDRTVSLVNAQARELFGQDSGKDFQQFFKGVPALVEAVQVVLEKGEIRRLREIGMSDGKSRRVLEASVSGILGWSGNIEGALCLVTDITELAGLRATMRTRETLASLGEMAAGIAHEFKNSLATIGGYARLLEKTAPDPKPAQSLRAEVVHLTQVVTDFLAFAKPQSVSFGPCDLTEVIRESAEAVRESALKNQVEVILDERFPEISGDPALLRRVFQNLILNGVEAVSEGCSERVVRVTGGIENGMARVAVSDTGDGIPDSVRPNVFIPFFSTKSQGHGMGLAIVQKIVVSHNGRIEIESQPGQGTSFSCLFPVSSNKAG